MCLPSRLAEDWVVKGCHIHIAGVELVVRPDHKGGVCFKPVFKVTAQTQAAVYAALNVAQDQCLIDPAMRGRWIRSLRQGMIYMLSFDGALYELAKGRMAEFKFLILALERYTE